MPLNAAERKMKKNLESTYGKARGERIFYAMEKQGRTPHTKEDTGTMKAKKKGYMDGGKTPMKKATADQKGLKKLPKEVRNKMGYMKDGGKVKKGYAAGGMTPQMGGTTYNQTSAQQQMQGMMGQQQTMAKGGKVKKGYAKGGKTGYANCGASMKPNGKSRS